MTTARKEQVSLPDTKYYHCISGGDAVMSNYNHIVLHKNVQLTIK